MDLPFIYDKSVVNKDFTGRRSECLAMSSLIASGENTVLIEPPKSGKKSLIQQTLFDMRLNGKQFNTAIIKMFNLRETDRFLVRFGSTVIRSVASSPSEYEKIIEDNLAGTHFLFDRQRFADCDEVLSLNWEADNNDMMAVFSLPYKIARETGTKMIVVLDEFQSILAMDRSEALLSTFEAVVKAMTHKADCSFIMTGSKVNAMKYIFCQKKYFYRNSELLPLQPIEERDLTEHIRKGFLKGGKEIEKELAIGVCRLFKGNIWYINHISAICDSMSKGYINEGIMMDALNALISIHEPRFISTMDSLTDYQTSFLRAVLEGVTKFSSTDVIEKYALNSSANVKRVKDALLKKEVITFDDNDEPVILDPLFEYWAKKYYFEI